MSEEFSSLRPLFNRASDGSFKLPEDGWYQLFPKGIFPVLNEAGERFVQVIDEEAITRMLNRFDEEAKRPHFAGVLIDYDHFSYDTDKSSEAAGWVVALKNRADGMWGQVKWTPEGEAALRNGKYRFASPVWAQSETSPVGPREERRVRPQRLESLGLTNNPNLRGAKPLSNRGQGSEARGQGASGQGASGQGSEGFNGGNATTNKGTMKKVNELLGLSPEAVEETAVAEIGKLKNRASTAEARVTELETQNKELLGAQVESDLERFKNRFKPEKRDAWKARLLKNRAETIETLEDITPVVEETKGRASQSGNENYNGRLQNRAAGNPGQGPGAGGALSKEQKAAKVEELVGDYRLKNRDCSLPQAYNAVERTHPDLFRAEEAVS